MRNSILTDIFSSTGNCVCRKLLAFKSSNLPAHNTWTTSVMHDLTCWRLNVILVTNWFSQTQQCNNDKGGQGYMFRPRFEAIFRSFVVTSICKNLINCSTTRWPPIEAEICSPDHLYRYYIVVFDWTSFYSCYNTQRDRPYQVNIICYIKGISPYRAVNTLHYGYEKQIS
jgi:hypothetical protein